MENLRTLCWNYVQLYSGSITRIILDVHIIEHRKLTLNPEYEAILNKLEKFSLEELVNYLQYPRISANKYAEDWISERMDSEFRDMTIIIKQVNGREKVINYINNIKEKLKETNIDIKKIDKETETKFNMAMRVYNREEFMNYKYDELKSVMFNFMIFILQTKKNTKIVGGQNKILMQAFNDYEKTDEQYENAQERIKYLESYIENLKAVFTEKVKELSGRKY